GLPRERQPEHLRGAAALPEAAEATATLAALPVEHVAAVVARSEVGEAAGRDLAPALAVDADREQRRPVVVLGREVDRAAVAGEEERAHAVLAARELHGTRVDAFRIDADRRRLRAAPALPPALALAPALPC